MAEGSDREAMKGGLVLLQIAFGTEEQSPEADRRLLNHYKRKYSPKDSPSLRGVSNLIILQATNKRLLWKIQRRFRINKVFFLKEIAIDELTKIE